MRKLFLTAILALILFSLAAGCSFLAGTGTVTVESSPAGASVYLNDTYKGTTPLTLNDVPQGTYILELRKPEYANRTETFTLKSGGTAGFSLSMLPLSLVNTPPLPPVSSQSEPSVTSATVPLTIAVQGDGTYSTKDVLKLSGTGPKGKSVSITITEPSGITYSSQKTAPIGSDGTWFQYFDLKTIPVAAGECRVTASVEGDAPETARTSIIIRN